MKDKILEFNKILEEQIKFYKKQWLPTDGLRYAQKKFNEVFNDERF